MVRRSWVFTRLPRFFPYTQNSYVLFWLVRVLLLYLIIKLKSMDFKNVNGLERMLGMCCEGNDSELNYCFMNEEWGDEELISEWGEEIYESYNELYDKINLMGVVWYESDEWGDFRFELENNEIKVIFGN